MTPTIIFVPGWWEGPTPFAQVSSLLQPQGFQTQTVSLPSTGTISPGNPSMSDDIAAIRSAVKKLVDAEQDVVTVLHSAGGFLGSNAIEGLGAKARGERGLKGGVIKIVFLTGAIFPQGFMHAAPPITIIDGGAATCMTPETVFFNDLDSATAEKWIKAMQPQPAAGWDETITYCGWKDVPSVYLVCNKDQAIPPPVQMQMAAAAGSKIEECDAGHMVIVSMPEKVAEVVKRAAEAA